MVDAAKDRFHPSYKSLPLEPDAKVSVRFCQGQRRSSIHSEYQLVAQNDVRCAGAIPTFAIAANGRKVRTPDIVARAATVHKVRATDLVDLSESRIVFNSFRYWPQNTGAMIW